MINAGTRRSSAAEILPDAIALHTAAAEQPCYPSQCWACGACTHVRSYRRYRGCSTPRSCYAARRIEAAPYSRQRATSLLAKLQRPPAAWLVHAAFAEMHAHASRPLCLPTLRSQAQMHCACMHSCSATGAHRISMIGTFFITTRPFSNRTFKFTSNATVWAVPLVLAHTKCLGKAMCSGSSRQREISPSATCRF